MGTSKALLPFGPESMLQRVVRLLGDVVSPIVVAAARGQELPELPDGVIVVFDDSDERGPLEALRAAWSAMPAEVDVAYVTSCDVPLLQPAFVRRMIELLSDFEIAAMEIDGFAHPLSGAYRRSTSAVVEGMLGRNELRVTRLLDLSKTRRVRAEEVFDIDPELRSLRNLNTREEYDRALLAYHEGR
jgi:molybdenum cofactor guanylyltransferase